MLSCVFTPPLPPAEPPWWAWPLLAGLWLAAALLWGWAVRKSRGPGE